MCSSNLIRIASKEDLPFIYRIEVEVFGVDAWHPAALGFFLYLDLARFLVYNDGEVVGYAIGLLEKRNYGHILNIAVRRDHRRKGVGSLLLSQL
ncbi:MAG: GNAT family N-acetyltransferase, partial [Desulfurococcales archaeon]|nr:GNAT family N-acetyltransferase [Desulfurococcales archaeon]